MTMTAEKPRKCKRFRRCKGYLSEVAMLDPAELYCSTDCCRIDHGLLDPRQSGDLRRDRKERKK